VRDSRAEMLEKEKINKIAKSTLIFKCLGSNMILAAEIFLTE
jgi:hypothetical protein